ncbi:hypothetical protein ACFRAE_08775 [Sphingobacterium sp. HJSM2_6]|uniref:hypothetical protein n=1 Tax=Sphingobacterium sp. HJSM2_6 TaxID=3366264 RepID=UPI003BE068FF
MNKTVKNLNKLNGWGIDEDKRNDPTYPMRDRYSGVKPSRPEQQIAQMEILHSNERPFYSAVFGETIPPKGVSGILRRYAFKYSESRYRHWVPLLIADRINVIEGILADFKEGKVPNIYLEKGGGALWKYDKLKFVKVFAGYVIATIAIAWSVRKTFKRNY